MKKRLLLKEVGIYVIFALIIYLFYRSWWAFILLIPAVILYHRYNRKNIERERRQTLGLQFKDALISMTAALRAGFSVENSLTESWREMKVVYGEDSLICTEFTKIINEIKLGIPSEEAFSRFASRSGVEDIQTFASVFQIAKRSGGDLVEIIRKTSDDISAKIDTKNEIAVLVSSKKFEQKIMSFMPLGIILYIEISSPDLLEPLYGNLTGILIMTVCLAIYAASYFLSGKIMNIEV